MQSPLDQRVSDLIGLIYEASLQPDLWRAVLEQVTRVTPCTVATFYAHDLVAHAPTFHQAYGTNPAYQRAYVEKWAASNPLIDAIALIEPGEVSGLIPIIDYEAFMRHPFYLEWGQPQGFCDAINIMLERTPTRFASVSLITSVEQGFANPAMLDRLRMLAPHFLRAVRIGRVLEQASVQAETLTQTLDALAAAVVLLRETGELVHANAHAQELMSRGLTLARINRGLSGLGHGASDPHKATAEAPGGDAFVVETGDGARFVCRTLPLVFANPAPALARSGALRLVVIQNTTLTASAADAAAVLFNLTARERDILFGLVEIGSPRATAALLGLSIETVKSYLKTLFRKTGTHRQAELVKLVSGLATPFHDPSA